MIKKSLGTFAIKSVGYLLGYLFSLLIARYFGPNEYGNFSSYYSLVMIIESFTTLGLGIANIRFLSSDPSRKLFYFLYKNSLLAIMACGSVFSLAVYYMAEDISTLFFEKPELKSIIQFASLSIIPSALIKYHANIFRSLGNSYWFAFLQFFSRHFFGLIIIIPLSFFVSEPIFVGFLVALIIQVIISALALNRNSFSTNDDSAIPKFSNVLKIGVNLMFSGIALILMGWVDTIMLTKYTSQANVGIYNISMKIAYLTSFGMISVNSVATPKLARFWADDDIDSFKKISVQSSTYIFYVTIFAVLFLLVAHQWILGIFGQEYLAGQYALLIILTGQSVNAFCGPSAQVLQMSSYEKDFRNILVAAVIINVVLNLVLIPKFSIEGAAVASAVAISFWNIASVGFIKMKLGFFVFPSILESKNLYEKIFTAIKQKR